MQRLNSVFISHSHPDSGLAAVFKEILEEVFAPSCTVLFSSDKTPGGGIEGGTNWLTWIHQRVTSSDETLLLLTPHSIQKTWPMWEAGAVSGVALAREQSPSSSESPQDQAVTSLPRSVIPLTFQLSPKNMQGPFQTLQMFNGNNEEDLKKLLGDLLKRYHQSGDNSVVVNALLEKYVPQLNSKLSEALRDTPHIVTEDVIQEWLRRLDDLRDQGRASEVRYYHRWISLMFDGHLVRNNLKSDLGTSVSTSVWVICTAPQDNIKRQLNSTSSPKNWHRWISLCCIGLG
ncbi:MAG: hypothetical protein ETSY2_48990 [Candidatus Entotheonella gemina]|uniref:TIR domain-containing protein n=1 Tax=Candidatus Entotheonella gemina TaxID=1429439 RepID=W4LC39_9BACT|nr:MAG: hypothetical protein ETSY2_48990 [Candidatus Entotheonella gemina]